MRLITALFSLGAARVVACACKSKAPPIPGFALRYAPIVYLYGKENFYPADIGDQLLHTLPELNYTKFKTSGPLTLDNLGQLNHEGGQDVYLTAVDDVKTYPEWLKGVKPDARGKTQGAVSAAIITVEKGAGIVDVFYMYFYAFDYGGDYFGLNVGNHVGDWEHNMIRFQNGEPQAVWYSQHSYGQAFKYSVTQKFMNGPRPVTYSSNGTHANYATPGVHDHTVPGFNLPAGTVTDQTSKGALWDITRNAYHVKYDPKTKTFSAYGSSGCIPTSWLDFVGHWGDKEYPHKDPRQNCPLDIEGLCRYQNGPTGPRDKELDRKNVCLYNKGAPCVIRSTL